MGEIFSVSRQKTQESPLTSTNMLKRLEVGKWGNAASDSAHFTQQQKNGCLASTLTRHPSEKISYSSAERRSQRSS